MKKLLSILAVMSITITAYAQAPFTIYKPLLPSTGGSYSQPSYNFGNSYDEGNYYHYNAPRSNRQENSQVISTRGYYVKDSQWYSVLLKVKVIGEDVYVVGIKRATGWSRQSTKAYPTDYLQEKIKEVFDYYIGDYIYGRIYF